jgi:pre-rRNA-processing protein TSR1
MVAEEVQYEDEQLVIGGVIRGRGLKADRLVHIQGFGDFQIEKVFLEHSFCISPRCRPEVHGGKM